MTPTAVRPPDLAPPSPQARAARSIAGQDVTELGGPGSLLSRQRRDHDLLDRLLDRLPTTRGAEQDELLTRIARLVFPHAYAEETVVWPAVRAALPDGEQLTLRTEQEHQQVNVLFSEIDRQPARRAELVDELVALLRQDVRDEEDLLLPRLQQALSAQQLRRLGLVWELVRRTAPTRPHPVVSRRPPGNLLSSLPLALLDRSRDRLDRTARTRPAAARAAVGASRALAAVAGAVEQLPVLRAGERAQTRSAA